VVLIEVLFCKEITGEVMSFSSERRVVLM